MYLLIPLLPYIVGGIVIAVIVINDKNKRERILESKDYQEWYDFYVKSGYSVEQSRSFAIKQCERGDKLSNYNIDPANPVAEIQSAAQQPIAETKKKDPYEAMNWILAVACFCVVAGLIAMVNSINDKLVAPLFIMLVFLLYVIGYAIITNVKVLKPVGKTFLISSLILMPFLSIPFTDIIGRGSFPFIIAMIICTVGYIIGAMILNSKFVGSLPYISFALGLWSFLYEFVDNTLWPYLLVTPLLVVAYISSYFYFTKASWLPICFRAGSYIMSKVSPILTLVYLFIILFSSNFATEFPLHRTFVAILLAALVAWGYITNHTIKKNLALRYYIQLVILVFCADLIGYPLSSIAKVGANGFNSNTITAVFAALWAASFFAQTVISLFIKHKEKADQDDENKTILPNLIAFGFSLVIPLGINRTTYGFTAVTVVALLAALGVLIAIKKKNVNWCYASYVAMILLAIILGDVVFMDVWSHTHTFIYFLCLDLLMIVTYPFLAIYNKGDARTLSITTALFSSVIAAFAVPPELEFNCIRVLIPTVTTWILGVIHRKQKFLREVGIYLSSCTLLVLCSDIGDQLVESVYATKGVTDVRNYILPEESKSVRLEVNNIRDIQKFIQCNLIGLTGALTTWLYDNWLKETKTRPWRFIIGYSIFTFMGSLVAIFARTEQNNLAIGLIFLLEQALILVFAAKIQKRWLAITSGVVLGIGGLYITEIHKHTSFMLIALGLGLIGIVAWQLVKMSKKNEAAQTENDKDPALPESKTDSTPSEDRSKE